MVGALVAVLVGVAVAGGGRIVISSTTFLLIVNFAVTFTGVFFDTFLASIMNVAVCFEGAMVTLAGTAYFEYFSSVPRISSAV